MNNYKSMDYMTTFISMRHVQTLFKINSYMHDLEYDSPEWRVANNELEDTLESITHEQLDELYENILNHFFYCGTEESNWTSGKLNSMIIQCHHLDVQGCDLGTVPDWEIDYIWDRAWLLKGVEPIFGPDKSDEFMTKETLDYLDNEVAKFNDWMAKLTLEF